MTPSLKISQVLINRLSTPGITEECSGKIYGILARNNLFILGLSIDVDEIDIDLVNSFPAEIDCCGIIQFGDGSFVKETVTKRLSTVDVTDNPIFINYNILTNKLQTYFFMNDRLESMNFNVIDEQEILTQFSYTRLTTTMPLFCELNCDSIKEALLTLRREITSGLMVFNFDKTKIYLMDNSSDHCLIGISGDPNVGELADESKHSSEGNGKKKKQQNVGINVLGVNLLKRITHDDGNIVGNHAPVCVLNKKQAKMLNFTVKIDSLAMIHQQTKIASLYEILVESAVRNLRLLEECILNSLNRIERKLSHPEVLHFYPKECGHFLTRIYQKDDSENVLLPIRKRLHQLLLLRQIRPTFRRANSYIFKSSNNPLINPHEGLKPTNNGGRISVVKGKYSYYHYGQNGMDDNGWGCAYRSLQTLCSWYKHQAYIDKDIPDFKAIQKCLVDIGDKPSNFIGSKQWIGSTEVGFVLDSLYGVTSRILYVSSGDEMATKGPELLNHFDHHGSPVMIGGGVLAHTILGVDYNEDTGNLKFLILDPHYTGAEDLHVIQNKGWCGWKGVDFWDKTAYYNMCLPQVSVGI